MSNNKIFVVLNNVRSLHNVGSIFRTSAGFGVEKIILDKYSPCPPRHEISKTALGGDKVVKFEQIFNIKTHLLDLQNQGFLVCAIEQTSKSLCLYEFSIDNYKKPLVLIFGHEREGVDGDILSICDLHIEIPMKSSLVKSFNVANSVAIVMGELNRQIFY